MAKGGVISQLSRNEPVNYHPTKVPDSVYMYSWSEGEGFCCKGRAEDPIGDLGKGPRSALEEERQKILSTSRHHICGADFLKRQGKRKKQKKEPCSIISSIIPKCDKKRAQLGFKNMKSTAAQRVNYAGGGPGRPFGKCDEAEDGGSEAKREGGSNERSVLSVKV